MRLLEKYPNIDTSSSVTGAIIFYGINSLATTLSNSQFYPTLPIRQTPYDDCAASTFGSIGNARETHQLTSYNSRRVPQRPPQPQQEPQAHPLNMSFRLKKEMDSKKDSNVAP
jgi:hypothetical protein